MNLNTYLKKAKETTLMARLILVYLRLNMTLLSLVSLLQKLCCLEKVKNVNTGSMTREGWFLRMVSELYLVSSVVTRANRSWGRYKREKPRKIKFPADIFSLSTN